MIVYREITLQELSEHILDIDVSEHGEAILFWEDGEVKARPVVWNRPRWQTEADWRDSTWLVIEKLPGVKAWGAFDGERMAGVIVYRPHLTADTAQLAALFVSRDHRRMGVAAGLFALLRQQAAADGHARLYVSATESESAVGFYRSRGFIPTQDVNPELFALEPNDIHMVMDL